MKRARIVIVAFLAIFGVASCGEDTVAPPTVIPETPGIPTDPNMVVSRLELDTLYYNEIGRLYGTGFGRSHEDLKLFIRTSEFVILDLTDTTIDFIVPEGAATGDFRLYRNDSQAVGKVRLHVVPHTMSEQFLPNGYSPLQGYEGEEFIVTGTNLDVRRRDASVKIGHFNLPIDSLTPFAIYARLPKGVQDGEVIVTLLGTQHHLGNFERLEHGGTFLEEQFTSFQLGLSLPLPVESNVQVIDEFGNLARDEQWIDLIVSHGVEDPNALKRIGDSIIYRGSYVYIDDTVLLDFRLHQPQGRNVISGMVNVVRTARSGTRSYEWKTSLVIEEMYYRHIMANTYDLTSTGSQSRDRVRLTSYSYHERDVDYEIRTRMKHFKKLGPAESPWRMPTISLNFYVQ